MIRFFRKIRQRLMSEGNVSKYLLYSIGEILLVVIGILIALQINNWNQKINDRNEQYSILEGILSDLEQDVESLNERVADFEMRLTYFASIDTTFELNRNYDVYRALEDTSQVLNYIWLMHRPKSFRSNHGTYKSMISDGKTSLIKNKPLLNKIQNIYDVDNEGLLSVYETIKVREESLLWSRSYELKYKPYTQIKDVKDKEFIAELNYFFESFILYHFNLKVQIEHAEELISEIRTELNNK